MSYVNHPDICLSGSPLTLISPYNQNSTVYEIITFSFEFYRLFAEFAYQ